MENTPVSVILFLGYVNECGKKYFPFYRLPENKQIYRDAQQGNTLTLINHNPSLVALPRQATIDRIDLDEEKNFRSIYLLSDSKEEVDAIVESDSRWEEVLEGNP